MYDVIANIIDHVWVTSSTSDQQYIYYICGCVLVILLVVFIDGIKGVFRHFWRP